MILREVSGSKKTTVPCSIVRVEFVERITESRTTTQPDQVLVMIVPETFRQPEGARWNEKRPASARADANQSGVIMIKLTNARMRGGINRRFTR